MANPKTDEIANTFYANPLVTLPKTSISFCPALDLVYNRNDATFSYYSNGAWFPIENNDTHTGDLACFISKFLFQTYDTNITNQKIIEARDALIRHCPNKVEGTKPSPYLVFEDSTIDLRDFSVNPHNRSYFATSYFPFPFNYTSQPTPFFDAYLERTFDDPVDRALITDMIAYYIIPQDEEPAFFYLYGPPRTGKSRLMHLMPKIIGDQITSAFSLQSLTTQPYAIAELSGKKLNALDEDESERIYSDKFKALIDHSKIEARRLYQPPFSFRPYTKFLFASNQLPKFQYIEGLERRMHLVHFQKPLAIGEQDKHLDDKLEAEIPGIIGKALIAAKQFINRNFEFIDSRSALAAKEEFLGSVMPSKVFLEECCTLVIQGDGNQNDAEFTANQALYNAYTQWCRDSGHRPLSSQNFHRQLGSLPGVISKKTNGIRQKNLVLKNPAQGDTPAPSMPF